MSRELAAWAPPFRMFIIGTGRRLAFTPPRKRNSGTPMDSAAALALAMDAARIALAPSLDLLGVPSAFSMAKSTVWTL